MSAPISSEPTPPAASSRTFQWIIGLMLLAYLATSVDFRSLRMKKAMITIGSQGWSAEQAEQRIRQEIIMHMMNPFSAVQEVSVTEWLGLAIRHEILDQEADALGLEVSDDCVKRSLQYKLAFLDANGNIDTKRRRVYYQNHVDALVWDRSMIHDESASFLDCDHNTLNQFWTQRQEGQGDQSAALQSRIQKFLVKNRITWRQLVEAECRLMRRVHVKKCVVNQHLLPKRFLGAVMKGIQQKITYQTRFFPAEDAISASMTSGEVAQHQRQLLQDSPDFLAQTGALADVTVMVAPHGKTVTPSEENREEVITQDLESGQALTDVAKRYGYRSVRVAMNVKGLTPTGAIAVEASMLPEASLKRVAKQAHEQATKDSSQRWFHQSVMLGGKVWVQVHGVSPSRPLTSHEIDARVRVSLGQLKAVKKTVKQAQEFQKQWQKASGKAKDKLAKTMQQRITSALSHGAKHAKGSPWERLPGLLWQVLQSPDQTMQILPVHNGCWVAVVQRVETVVPTNAKGSTINTHELEKNTHDQWAKQAQNQWMQRVLSLASTKTDPELWAAWLQKMRHAPQGDEDALDLEDMD